MALSQSMGNLLREKVRFHFLGWAKNICDTSGWNSWCFGQKQFLLGQTWSLTAFVQRMWKITNNWPCFRTKKSKEQHCSVSSSHQSERCVPDHLNYFCVFVHFTSHLYHIFAARGGRCQMGGPGGLVCPVDTPTNSVAALGRVWPCLRVWAIFWERKFVSTFWAELKIFLIYL